MLLYLFPCGMYQSPLLLCFLWPGHIYYLLLSSPPSFYFYIWILLFAVPNSPVSKILYFFLYSFLPSHLYFTSTSPLPPHCITLVTNILYLFWGFSFFFFSSSFFVLQLWARCPNFPQLQHSLSLLLSNCTLSKVRAHFFLSIFLNRLLYYC